MLSYLLTHDPLKYFGHALFENDWFVIHSLAYIILLGNYHMDCSTPTLFNLSERQKLFPLIRYGQITSCTSRIIFFGILPLQSNPVKSHLRYVGFSLSWTDLSTAINPKYYAEVASLYISEFHLVLLILYVSSAEMLRSSRII